MGQRTYTLDVEIEYTIGSQVTAAALTEECKRCERSIRAFLKERGAQNARVVINYVQADDPQ